MTTQSGQPEHDSPTSRSRHRLLVVVRSFAIAAFAAMVITRVMSPPIGDFVVVCVTWIAFYPVARLNPKASWWAHWARGIVVLIGFLLALRYFR